MNKILSSLGLLAFAISPHATQGQGDDWPNVREFEITVGFSAHAERFDLLAPIYSDRGDIVYWLICKGGSDENLDRLSDESGTNFVGPLSCRLDTEKRDSSFSLLTEDDVPVWHTRGQFHFSELIGTCGVYPEYGRVRHFRLRGFELTLQVEDPVVRGKTVEYFLLKISLRQDRAIRSATAERPGYLNPYLTAEPPQPRGCDRVLEGNEPRMCRNSVTMSWEPCTER